jgi:hypothetical protein
MLIFFEKKGAQIKKNKKFGATDLKKKWVKKES